jgi:hypothetical protein
VVVQTLGLDRFALCQDTAGALNFTRNTAFSVTDAPNSFKDISTYNNYYEFGTAWSSLGRDANNRNDVGVPDENRRRAAIFSARTQVF